MADFKVKPPAFTLAAYDFGGGGMVAGGSFTGVLSGVQFPPPPSRLTAKGRSLATQTPETADNPNASVLLGKDR